MFTPDVDELPVPEGDSTRPAPLESARVMMGPWLAGVSDGVDVMWRRGCVFCLTRRFDAASVVGLVDAVAGLEVVDA